MNARQLVLRPADVAVALAVALRPGGSFRALAEDCGLSVGEAHNAVRRLEQAQLLSPSGRRVRTRPLFEFLRYGVPHAFPGLLGPETRGVPTAGSGPAFRKHLAPDRPVVWPYAEGKVRGDSLVPLYAGAPGVAGRHPRLYEALTLVDALRIGRARERQYASKRLQALLRTTGSKRA